MPVSCASEIDLPIQRPLLLSVYPVLLTRRRAARYRRECPFDHLSAAVDAQDSSHRAKYTRWFNVEGMTLLAPDLSVSPVHRWVKANMNKHYLLLPPGGS